MIAPDIHGTCPDHLLGVKDAFAANFTEAPEGLNELAARFSVCVEGELVLDLWAGHADLARTVAFGPRTLVPVFSTGKAVMATLIATCVERGLLDYEAPVTRWWPEFGRAGKAGITLGQLMSHQAGLPGLTQAIDPELWFDRAAMLDLLAAQAPLWAPGTASGYHPNTIGLMADELFRRADGRSMGQALREDFLGLDLWIGLPEAEHGRVAQVRKPSGLPRLGELDAVKKAAFYDRGAAPGPRETAQWRMAEIPSSNAHGKAEALARFMAIMADGRFEGRQILSPATLEAARRERVRGQDRVLPFVMGWAAGFTRNAGLNVFGPGQATVGHYGWGGSCAFADPERGLSASYVMTRQSPHLIGDPRALRLIEALYAAL